MKRKIALVGAVFGIVLICLWCLLPFKIGELGYSTPMSPENLILVRAGSEERLAEHLRGVTDYVAKLGAHLKLESYTRVEQPPLSRFLPFPHDCAAPYNVRVTFSDGRGERYTAIFSGEIGFESRGLASPRYITRLLKECVDTAIATVFGQSPATIQKLLQS